MATIPNPERVNAVRGIFTLAGENPETAAQFLNYLNKTFPLSGFVWADLLRTEARIWQPYIQGGLSIDPWVDEVVRISTILGQQ